MTVPVAGYPKQLWRWRNKRRFVPMKARFQHRGGIRARVGAVWPHKNGNGFDLIIPEGITLSGRVVLQENKPKPPKA